MTRMKQWLGMLGILLAVAAFNITATDGVVAAGDKHADPTEGRDGTIVAWECIDGCSHPREACCCEEGEKEGECEE